MSVGLRTRCQSSQLLLLLVMLGLLLKVAACHAEPESSPPEMLADAELTDIYFLDVDRGWAVGDRGVILMTENGGRRWRQADCPINCRLESVFFIDEQRGWAVGGWAHPYTHKSSGVVLRTENGGRRWTRVPAATLPALKQVHFLDHRHGWAIGNSSAMYPAGVFRTQDGGRAWTVVPHASADGWVAGRFLSPHQAVVLGRSASIAVVAGGKQTATMIPNAGLRRTSDLYIAPQGQGWIVGDGGLVLVSDDRGESWHPCSSLPAESRHFDFRSLAKSGSDIWIAGVPGSCVFHSADEGQSWELLRTGESPPIRKIYFLDRQRGWAVGALGTVLATRDGGITWLRQRGGQRVSLLGLFSEANKIPLELLTRVSGDEGYVSAVEILTRRDVELASESESSWEDRAHEAVVTAGGSAVSTAWQFPLRQPGLLLPADAVIEGWDIVHQAEGLKKLEEHLVKLIRQWRPDVIVTEPPSPSGDHPVAHLINQVALSANQLASQPTAYPEQISQLGLQPWAPKKLLAVSQDQQPGTLTIQTSRLATRLGRSLADYAAYSRGLIQTRWEPPQKSIGFRLLVTQLPRELAERDFFSGIGITPGQDARRALGQATGDLRSLSKAAQKQRNIQQLLGRTGDQHQDGRAWLAQVDDLTRGLSPGTAAHILYQLAQHYRAAGRYDLTAETLLLLVRRQPDHPMTEPALLWLMRFANSSEVQWGLLQRRGNRDALEGTPSAATAVVPAGYTTAGEISEAGRDDRPRRLPNTVAQAASELGATNQTIKLGEFIRRTRPPLYADPAIRFALAAARRKSGSKPETLHLWQQLAVSELADGWTQAARGELWLDNRRGRCPKPVLSCGRAREKPHLDGQLDEPCWEACQPAILASTLQEDQEWPATVRLAYDAEYLYLGIQCRKAAQAEYPTSDQTRARDPDLQDRDRVDVLIDIDRDYTTYFRLTVDYRGWTGEACFGDIRWNPDWYVAARSDDETWTAEAAIALQELTLQAPLNDTWVVGIQRTVPGVGFQSWTRPAAVSVRPEGFGFLRFEARRPK